jgi:hypothetical protein
VEHAQPGAELFGLLLQAPGSKGEKTSFLAPCFLQAEHSPRQARDRHRENSKSAVFSQADVPGSAFQRHYPDFDIEAFAPPDCPRNKKCGPALWNQTYRNNIAVNTTSLVPFPSTSGMPAGTGIWRATSDAGESVGPPVRKSLFAPFDTSNDPLPRQARDKHRQRCEKEAV